jgi:DNA-binding FadR family transcriptional regulator
MSAELAAERATGEERMNLRTLAKRMRSSLTSMDEYAELDAQLHLLVVQYAHNSLLSHLVESIRGPLRTSIEAGLVLMKDDHERLDEMQHGHEAIVEAVVSGDGAQARQLMERHIGGASRRIAMTALHAGLEEEPSSAH